MEQVIQLHRDLVQAGPLLHRDKLEAAVEAPFAGVVDQEFYPTLTQKAVKLVDAISRAQAFQDGNKRLAWLCMTTFVELNGLIVREPDEPAAAAWVINLRGDENGLWEGVLWLNERLSTSRPGLSAPIESRGTAQQERRVGPWLPKTNSRPRWYPNPADYRGGPPRLSP